MYKVMASLFNQADRLIKLSNDAIVVYLILRTDVELGETETARHHKSHGELLSGLSVQTIALRSRCSNLTVIRILDELVKFEWIEKTSSNCFKLGEIKEFKCEWMLDKWITVDKEVDKSTSIGVKAMIKGLLAEREERKAALVGGPLKISEEAKKRLLYDALGDTEKGKSTKVLKHFQSIYREAYKEEPIGFYSKVMHRIDPKMYAYANRILEWQAGDVDAVCGLITWTISEWEHLSAACGLVGKPTFGVMSTRSFFEKFIKYREFGLPIISKVKDKDGTAFRADAAEISKAPDTGW